MGSCAAPSAKGDDKFITTDYLQQCHITYTAGVAPASRPEVALVVVINNPKAGQHFGGSVAAPVFGQIIGPVLTRLKIAPDALRAPVVHRQSG
ncbi:hypothetical protein ELE18_00340 (plasmid) [Klebsiella quasipneumoniae]|nr:hypothetical protein ELE18_00340 [Klebsiella quasipneumoniae]